MQPRQLVTEAGVPDTLGLIYLEVLFSGGLPVEP